MKYVFQLFALLATPCLSRYYVGEDILEDPDSDEKRYYQQVSIDESHLQKFREMLVSTTKHVSSLGHAFL